jgi:hypothetical protein
MHDLLCTGGANILVVPHDDWRKQEARDARDAAVFEHKIPLLAWQYQDLQVAVECVREQVAEHPTLSQTLRREGLAEKTVVWREGASGFWCRCRPDVLYPGLAILDWKLTGTAATPEVWGSRTALELGYDFRSAFYRRGVRIAFGQHLPYWFVVIEAEPPYALTLFRCTSELDEWADVAVEETLAVWETCLRKQVWPAYGPDTQWIELPTWARYRREAIKARLGFTTRNAIEHALALQAPIRFPGDLDAEGELGPTLGG